MTQILSILKKTNALLTDDHFVYTSGKHGSVYINKDIMYIHTRSASQVGKMFAEIVQNYNVNVVAAPALGGIVLSQWTAFHLSKILKREILSVYTEKTLDKNQIFTRGYDAVVKGKKVLVIEDLVTTGGSVKKVVDSVKACGGKVVAVGVMVDRSPSVNPVTKKIFGGIPFFALGRLPVDVFAEKECPLCKKGIPINTSIGHGRKFIESKKTK